jgi:hypothetical protein
LERSDIKKIKGEPDLRGAPAVAGAGKVCKGTNSGGLERNDIKKEGLPKQAFQVEG